MIQNYLEQYMQEAAPGEPAWLKKIRRNGLDRFAQLGFPTVDWEEWRFTNVRSVAENAFHWAKDKDPRGLDSKGLARFPLNPMEDWGLVFINGHYFPELSQLKGIPEGVRLLNLSQALEQFPNEVEPYLGKLNDQTENPFVALNSAFIRDGVFLSIPKDCILPKPLYIIYVSKPNGVATVSYPRNLLVIGEGAQASIVEAYLGSDHGPYLTDPVTEVWAGPGAQVEHYKIQGEGGQAFHIGQTTVNQARDSQYNSHVLSLGGVLSRNQLETRLSEVGANCHLNGLYLGLGVQVHDNHTVIDHASPHGTSLELYKGILGGKSKGVFSGKILVRPGAEKTQAGQTNKNLLISDDAVIDTKPILEIFNNDVKCNHGATIGRLDPNQVFYLRSRGVDLDHAKDLLTYAFASDLMSTMKIPALKVRLQEWISLRLMRARHSEDGRV